MFGYAAIVIAMLAANDAPGPGRAASQPSATAPAAPTAVELLALFAQHRKAAQSFMVKAEHRIVQVGGIKTPAENLLTDLRVDAERGRFACRWTRWYDDGVPNPPTNWTEDRPGYNSYLWDGREYYGYGHSGVAGIPDSLLLDRRGKAPTGGWMQATAGNQAALLGYFTLDEHRRFDEILLKGGQASVRRTPERIAGSDCWLVEARTPGGQYKVWLDPAHGYNIAQAETRKGPGDMLAGRRIPEGFEFRETVRNVQFRQIGQAWVAMEADIELVSKSPDPLYTSTYSIHHKKTEVLLSPDFDALKAFLPDDIRDGTKVAVTDGAMKPKSSIPADHMFTWQGSKLVPYVDPKKATPATKPSAPRPANPGSVF